MVLHSVTMQRKARDHDSLTRRRVEDLEFARKQYVLRSRAFTSASRRRALEYIERLSRRAGALSREKFLVGVMRITAYAHNGHDSFDFGDGAWEPEARLPLRLIAFPDAWIIARAAPEQADLIGARVLRLEGLTSRRILQRLMTVSGGKPEYVMWNAMWVVELAGLLHALRVARSPNHLQFALRLRNGRRLNRVIQFVPRPQVPRGASSTRLWSTEPFDIESKLGAA